MKNEAKATVPHVWHTTDSDGGDCRHLAMCPVGAEQAHLLHHGMMNFNGELVVGDEGVPHLPEDLKGALCLEIHCVLYGLRFPSGEQQGVRFSRDGNG
jgi:hypothetical protein